MKQKPDKQTAYQHNAHSISFASEANDHGWAKAINRMIEQRYAFLALEYENDGYLFRGMSSGLFEALLDDHFWHYSGEDSGNQFEKDLDVLLLTQDFSDAFTVSKLWEQKPDACIIIFRSEIFNNALNDRKAAMMATAEPGVVFKYPFLSHALTSENIEYLVVSADLLNVHDNREKINTFKEMDSSKFNKLTTIATKLYAAGKIIVAEYSKENVRRSSLEKVFMDELLKRAVFGAKAINTDIKPTRRI